MPSTAPALGQCVHDLKADDEDLALADRSLVDTVGVTLAAREHPVTTLADGLDDAGRWAANEHGLDTSSTTHVNSVYVSVTLVTGRASRLPGYSRGDGPSKHRTGLVALLNWLACHVHSGGASRGRWRRCSARPGRRCDRTGSASCRRRAADVRHRRLISARRFRCRRGNPGWAIGSGAKIDSAVDVWMRRAVQNVTAMAAGADSAHRLGCVPGLPVLRIEPLYRDRAPLPLELAVSHFQPGHYSHRIQLRGAAGLILSMSCVSLLEGTTGGYGYSREYDRTFRLPIGEGMGGIQKMIIGRSLAGPVQGDAA
jgi:hypothetical protein